ncbi:hypothetical protein [Hyphobacterium sp. CCMP332]|uniref:hypothetical protein n=1 Tax=Hyphobacterium sp. CCMP332 TaxID=2749086 RepID=UPI001F1CEAB4|nr:hypothetical protein [Hyphobacterium sp. CCMP332]
MAEGLEGEAGVELFSRAHDLRGMGTTYKFPIITRMAGSLSKLIESEEKRAIAPAKLALAHTSAIRAALRQDIRDEKNPVGRALATELETQVLDLVAEFESAGRARRLIVAFILIQSRQDVFQILFRYTLKLGQRPLNQPAAEQYPAGLARPISME